MAPRPPLVSVIVPCFNAQSTLARALASVAIQDYPAIEVIAVDDGSTDRTSEILAALENVTTRVVRLPTNRGVAAARNAGLAVARGDYVAFLDADDEWLPTKILRQMAIIGKRPEMAFVSCDAQVIDANGRVQQPALEDLLPDDPAAAWKVLLADTFVWTPTVVARRSAIERAGGFDTSLVIAEDQDLWIRLAFIGEVGFVNERKIRRGIELQPMQLDETGHANVSLVCLSVDR